MSQHFLPPPRRSLSHGASRKRKEREEFVYPPTPSPLPVGQKAAAPPPSKAVEPVSSNRVLAGFMAHEFLTKGTLLGEKFDLARAESVPLTSLARAASMRKPSLGAEPNKKSKPANSQSYSELSSLLINSGTHIPGIFNPTQLGQWIQM